MVRLKGQEKSFVRKSLSYKVKPNYSMSSKENKLISRIHITCNIVPRILKDKQNTIFVVFEILANVLLTLINWLLKPKCMLKHCFFFVWKTQYDFLALRHLAICTKTFFFLFSNFFLFLEVLTKTGYFNIGFVFFKMTKNRLRLNKTT